MNRLFAGLSLLLLAAALPSAAQTASEASNPQPLPDDFILPMPRGLSMVFRVVKVPGADFWGDRERFVMLGAQETRDNNADIFETPTNVMATGSFPDADGKSWIYHLGKYEVSKAQFIAVLGNGDEAEGLQALAAASSDPSDAKLADLSPEARARQLAKPVASVGWLNIERFIDAYNRWCFGNADCLAKLPRLDDVPGFFRLPSEIEWEYAARGGVEALHKAANATVFSEPLPFPKDQWGDYAAASPKVKGETRRIGSLKATYGFHDLFGNVQELTLNAFQPELGQGKVGALVARGGSFLTNGTELRSSLRSEVEIYRWDGSKMEEQKSRSTGFRLAIGSLTVPTAQFRGRIVESYVAYQQDLQRNTPNGATLTNPIVQATTPLQTANANLGVLASKNATLTDAIERIRGSLRDVQKKLDAANRETCLGHARDALYASREYARATFSRSERHKVLVSQEELPTPDAQSQSFMASLREGLKNLDDARGNVFDKYVRDVIELNRCGPDVAKMVLAQLEGYMKTERDKAGLSLLRKHVAGPTTPETWRSELDQTMAKSQFFQ